MANTNNKVVDYGGNGLQFANDGDNRPRIQDVADEEFTIYGLVGGSVDIHKDDIDDLIILLQEVKEHGYKIEY